MVLDLIVASPDLQVQKWFASIPSPAFRESVRPARDEVHVKRDNFCTRHRNLTPKSRPVPYNDQVRRCHMNAFTPRFLLSPGVLALAAAVHAQGGYSVVALDPLLSERWPQPGTFAVRRTSAGAAETVAISLKGTARAGIDYTVDATTSVSFPAGSREVWVTISPRRDQLREVTETVVLALRSGGASATMRIEDNGPVPTETEAVRFLVQAGFGADPATLAEVRRTGFAGWIDAQLTRPKSYLQPAWLRRAATGISQYHPSTKIAFWERVMKPLPPSGTDLPDPLRQRVAYSLLQIFVISQTNDALANYPEAVCNYYDKLMDGAFGSYGTMLKDVTLHACMGRYLSHVGNQKADPALNRFPDENYAREIMQLFSIGLWELNPDGSRKIVNGQFVPAYNQNTIREYAKVFTGYQYGGPNNDSFQWAGEHYNNPMKLWDDYHDLGPKTLLSGVTTPQRVSGGANSGAAAMADLDAAMGSLANHPNVGPFIGRLLIQRMVTSNPTPAYVGRVAAKFANNGSGVRGNMGAVVKQILLDPEARSYEATLAKGWGKKREPYLTLLNLAKTFDAAPANGDYENATYLYDELRQEPFQSPSVFNFYLPGFRPSGDMTRANLAGPEFQIMTAVTAHGALNLSYKMIYEDLSRWGGPPETLIRLKPTELIPLAGDPDALVTQIGRKLLDRPIHPRAFQAIREAVAQLPNGNADEARARVNMALYLVVSSPDFQIQK